MKKFIITNLLLLTLLSLPSTVSAFTGYRTYTNYNLYSACYNNYTAKHAKETDNQYISNYVKKFTNTNKATFWAADGNSKNKSYYKEKQRQQCKTRNGKLQSSCIYSNSKWRS